MALFHGEVFLKPRRLLPERLDVLPGYSIGGDVSQSLHRSMNVWEMLHSL